MMFRQRPPSGSKSWKWRRCDRFPPRNCNACSMARLIETVSALSRRVWIGVACDAHCKLCDYRPW